MNENKNEMIVLFPGGEWSTNIRTPPGLCAKIDELLAQIKKTSGIKFSRNAFILKSIKFFFDHLLISKDINDLIKKMEDIKIK